MREQPHYTDLLTEEFFTNHYVQERMSYPKIREMLLEQGHNVSVGTLYKYAKSFGIGRDHSEAARNKDPEPLDYSISFLDEKTLEAIDGFLLGDGGIQPNANNATTARAKCGLEHEEFCNFMMKPFLMYNPVVKSYKVKNMKSGILWHGQTKMHPDLCKQYQRWYPIIDGKPFKVPPDDVRITPRSVMLWYLGDGSLVKSGNSVMMRLSTDYFPAESVEMLADKLKALGILCHRNNDNRIMVEARGLPSFFDFLGRKSPVKCYDYKFELPEWRYTSKRMRDVANDLGVSYNRLSYLVKNGKLKCYRASEKGRPRMLPEHIENAKELIKSGELY